MSPNAQTISGTKKGHGRPKKNNKNLPSNASTASNSPAASETPPPKQPKPGPGKITLNDSDRLALARLCVAYQAEHRHGEKGRFWTKMAMKL